MEAKFTEAFNTYCKQHKLPIDNALLLEYSENNKHIYLITSSSTPANLHLLVINFHQTTNLFNSQSFSISHNTFTSITTLNNTLPHQIHLHPFNKNQLALVYSHEVQFITNINDSIKNSNERVITPQHSYKCVHSKSNIKQFKWSYFDNCYGVLYNDGTFCYCDVSCGNECMFEIDCNNNNSKYSDDSKLVDFAFCPKYDKGFEMFCVYLLYENGLIEVCGPFLPKKFTLDASFINNTRCTLNNNNIAVIQQHAYTNYNYCNELLNEIEKCSTTTSSSTTNDHVVAVNTNMNLQSLNNNLIVKRHLYILPQQMSNNNSNSVFNTCTYVKLVVVHCMPFTCLKIGKGGEIDVVMLCEKIFPMFRRGIRFKDTTNEDEGVVFIEGRTVEKIVIGCDIKDVVRGNKEGNELYVKAGEGMFKVEMKYLEKLREVVERKCGNEGRGGWEGFSIVKKVVDMKKREIKRKEKEEVKDVKEEKKGSLVSEGNSFINDKQEDKKENNKIDGDNNKNSGGGLFQSGNNNSSFTFGNTSFGQNNMSGGLFGNNAKDTNTNTNTNQQQTTGGSLFGKINTGSLGLLNNNNSSLFNKGTNTNTGTSNLFGGKTSNNASNSGLFGGMSNIVTNNSSLFGGPPNTSNLFSGTTNNNANTSGLFGGANNNKTSNLFSGSTTTNNIFGASTNTNTNTNTGLFGGPANTNNIFGGASNTSNNTNTNTNTKGNLFNAPKTTPPPTSISTSEPKDTSKQQQQPQQSQSLPSSTPPPDPNPKEPKSIFYSFTSLLINPNHLLILYQNTTTFQTQAKLLPLSHPLSTSPSTMFTKSIPLHPILSTHHSLPSYTTTSTLIQTFSSSLTSQPFQTTNPFKHTTLSINLSSTPPDTNIEQFLLSQVNSLISFYENSIYFNYTIFISKCNIMLNILNEIDMTQCEQRYNKLITCMNNINDKMKTIQHNSNIINEMIMKINTKITKMCAFNNKKNKALRMVEEFQKESIEKMKDLKKIFEVIDMKYKDVINKFNIDGVYYDRLAIGNEYVDKKENMQESLGLYIDKEIKRIQSK